jgi:hypothetical protein
MYDTVLWQKTAFYTVRQPGLSRLSLQDGTHWRAFCYYDIRAYTLTPELLVPSLRTEEPFIRSE